MSPAKHAKHATNAYSILKPTLSERDVDLGTAALLDGKYSLLFRNQPIIAMRRFEEALEIFKRNPNHPDFLSLVESAARSLVSTYSITGREGLATKACVEIGALREKLGKSGPYALYFPGIPRRNMLTKEEAKASFVFDVTENGVVENIQLVSSMGRTLFTSLARESIEKSRYAPDFSEKKPTRSNGLIGTITLDNAGAVTFEYADQTSPTVKSTGAEFYVDSHSKSPIPRRFSDVR